MSKPQLERRQCACKKEYLYGGIYCEPVCPVCYPAHHGFSRNVSQTVAYEALVLQTASPSRAAVTAA